MARQPQWRPGQVRDATVSVLQAARKPMLVNEIHPKVEENLGGTVRPSSVRSYLQTLVKDGRAVRKSRGLYEWKR